jgi:hypothetical protein
MPPANAHICDRLPLVPRDLRRRNPKSLGYDNPDLGSEIPELCPNSACRLTTHLIQIGRSVTLSDEFYQLAVDT